MMVPTQAGGTARRGDPVVIITVWIHVDTPSSVYLCGNHSTDPTCARRLYDGGVNCNGTCFAKRVRTHSDNGRVDCLDERLRKAADETRRVWEPLDREVQSEFGYKEVKVTGNEGREWRRFLLAISESTVFSILHPVPLYLWLCWMEHKRPTLDSFLLLTAEGARRAPGTQLTNIIMFTNRSGRRADCPTGFKPLPMKFKIKLKPTLLIQSRTLRQRKSSTMSGSLVNVTDRTRSNARATDLAEANSLGLEEAVIDRCNWDVIHHSLTDYCASR
ncbi:hypothetical protein J6590_033327 [Homalodisca vitripennis]|nr:hypothetical protein J6590_033327 [Homalodisca vitripennis]